MKYIIDEKELISLLEARDELDALECGGVDNWEWYSEALSDREDVDYKEYVKQNYESVK